MMRLSRLTALSFAGVAALLAVWPQAQARNKKPKARPQDAQDSIQVVGHIALANGSVRRFVTTQHYSSYYLYAEHDGGKRLTLLDVSDTAHPTVLADMAYPSAPGGQGTLLAVAGTAALVLEDSSPSPAAPATAAPQTVLVMDFSDPHSPKIARSFFGVTAASRDERRGLIFLANADGLWILRQGFADDPEIQKAYARHVLNDH